MNTAKLMKKSFNIDPEISRQLDNLLSSNPSISFTLAINQALKAWLIEPKIDLKTSKYSIDDLDEFMNKHKELMVKLSR